MSTDSNEAIIANDNFKFNTVDGSVIITSNEDLALISNYAYWIEVDFDINILCTTTRPDPLSPEFIAQETAKHKLPQRIINDINYGIATLVLNHGAEGWYDIDWEFLSTVYGVPTSKIIWLTGIYNFEEIIEPSDVVIKFYPVWERLLGQFLELNEVKNGIHSQLNSIENLEVRPSMGSCYNRRPTQHRHSILTTLLYHEELHKMIWSWGGYTSDEGIRDEVVTRMKFLDVKYKERYEHIFENKFTPTSNDDITDNKAMNINYEHVRTTYYQLITETFFDKKGIFLSEKSYKPFITCQPFLIVGQQHTVRVLRERGYDVYDKWIDHSYDTIDDDKKRMAAITKEVIRLNSMSQDEWGLMLKDMLPTIKKNLKTFYKNVDVQYNWTDDNNYF